VEDSDNTSRSSVVESACLSDNVESLPSEPVENEILAVAVLLDNLDAKITSSFSAAESDNGV
jgi:hypothetical protein